MNEVEFQLPHKLSWHLCEKSEALPCIVMLLLIGGVNQLSEGKKKMNSSPLGPTAIWERGSERVIHPTWLLQGITEAHGLLRTTFILHS